MQRKLSSVAKNKKSSSTEVELLQRKRDLLIQKKKIEHELPHLHSFPFYKWSRKIFDNTQNRFTLLSAANQISKSSTAIRRCIKLATDKEMWRNMKWKGEPKQFWYFYPSRGLATIEFDNKWVKEFLPRGEMKTDPVYGWKEEKKRGEIHAIHFNSGVSVYFMSYEMDVMNLQASTIHAIFADEELPMEFWDELVNRLSAVDGFFHLVCTPTLNQDEWRRAFEPQEDDIEFLPGALKMQISLYDCQYYEDGSPSPWTLERIRERESLCKSETERQRRIYGKFVTESGRKISEFEPTRHYIPAKRIEEDWLWYGGADYGSGGEHGHPAAITFVAVRPDYKLGYVVRCWRGDGIKTTAGDVLDKFRELRGPRVFVGQVYDHASSDFGELALRDSEPFTKADKSRTKGFDLINALFKNDQLFVFNDLEGRKLGTEFISLMDKTKKIHASDDLTDALRYTLMQIPWALDFRDRADPTKEKKEIKPETEQESLERRMNERRGIYAKNPDINEDQQEFEDEIDEWNEMLS